MSEAEPAAGLRCPKCGHINQHAALFCGACGDGLIPKALRQPPPSSKGAASTVNVGVEANAAYAQALDVLEEVGAVITWRQAPTTALFKLTKKSALATGGLPVAYRGELTITGVNARQSQAWLSARPNWLILLPIVMLTQSAAFFMSIVKPMGSIWELFSLAALAFSAYTIGLKWPREVSAQVLQRLQDSGGIASGPSSPPALAPAEPPPAADTFAQLKTLAELRDSGAITVEEFEAKKTVLLGRPSR